MARAAKKAEPWKAVLTRDREDWLLEPENPFVRYWSLRWLRDRSRGDKELDAAHAAVEESPQVRGILDKQKDEGYWGSSHDAFKGTKGQLCMLLWLGHEEPEAKEVSKAPPNAGGSARRAVEYQVGTYVGEDGAFRYTMAGSRNTVVLPCHGAELGRAMLAFGASRDRRLTRLVGWLASLSGPDGSLPCPSKAGSPPCLFATAGLLRLREELLAQGWLLSASSKLRSSVDRAAEAGAELFLSDGFARAARNKPTERWFTFGFPLQWESDELELLRLVAPFASPGDERARPLIDRILAKQLPDGTWPCEKAVKGAKWMSPYTDPAKKGVGSKWVTLAAYRSLKTAAHLLED
jgi:hypothetical protein